MAYLKNNALLVSLNIFSSPSWLVTDAAVL